MRRLFIYKCMLNNFFNNNNSKASAYFKNESDDCYVWIGSNGGKITEILF